MKYLLFLFFIVGTTQFFTCSGMATFETTAIVISSNSIESFPAYLVTDQQTYTTGGVVFTYPSSLFTLPPTISATIQTPSHADTITYTVEISSGDANSATAMVYENNSGALTEAGDGSVTIHFTATGT